MKKICFVVPIDKKNGIYRVVYNLAKKITGYEICFIYPNGNKNDIELLKNEFSVIERKISNKKITNYITLVGDIKKSVNEEKIDLLIVAGCQFNIFAYLAIKNTNCKIISWEHLNFKAGPKYRLEYFGKRLACKRFSQIVCITKKDANYYNEFENKNKIKNNIAQIYNLSNYRESKNEYNAESKKIMSCGYLSKIKGFDYLVQVGKIVFKAHPDWQWDIYGTGDEKENLLKSIKKNGLQSNILLKGYADNIDKLYKDYSMFVLTSRKEGMGMVLIEAQLSKLPIVSFDIDCGPSDVISNEKNGFLVSPFDINEMATKINILIERNELRKSFSENSQINLVEFSEKIIIKKWENLIDKVLKTNK